MWYVTETPKIHATPWIRQIYLCVSLADDTNTHTLSHICNEFNICESEFSLLFHIHAMSLYASLVSNIYCFNPRSVRFPLSDLVFPHTFPWLFVSVDFRHRTFLCLLVFFSIVFSLFWLFIPLAWFSKILRMAQIHRTRTHAHIHTMCWNMFCLQANQYNMSFNIASSYAIYIFLLSYRFLCLRLL